MAKEFRLQIKILFGIVVLLWAIEIVDQVVFRGALNNFGIRPRSLPGLFGIFFAPFLHGNFAHLIANTVPLVSLGWLIMLRETEDFIWVSIISAIVGGFGTWLIGSPASHIGASGVIFGYFGFLLLRGYFERSAVAIAFSLLVAFLYGGIIWGVLPTQPGVSWEGHLFGFLGGVLAARLLSRPKQPSNDF
ncbi:peptidase, S54 (rhomboid) family [Synechococcus sp. PCC 7335]|uniref:rhomboid family intramembrane serine protease n=1 Tax=Synechococcus sp. (strain ATCC 29403 / PCC 7335) TaxID=91464 RepID=UPI00017EC7AC|nr:rhomboid family intramembrane serine protease [Synechococcus sp. PCC 7335]EDX84734.1 peptidase, S54 (rhomboid) family [Synechococcus sp. PCC 7335]